MATAKKTGAAASSDATQATETTDGAAEVKAAATVVDGEVAAIGTPAATEQVNAEPAAIDTTAASVSAESAAAEEHAGTDSTGADAVARDFTVFGMVRALAKAAQEAGNHAEHALLNDIEVRLGELRTRLNAVGHELSEEAEDFVSKLKHLLTP